MLAVSLISPLGQSTKPTHRCHLGSGATLGGASASYRAEYQELAAEV